MNTHFACRERRYRLGMPATATLMSLAAGLVASVAFAGEPPFSSSARKIPITHHDRVYAAEQYSNTVSVIDPAANRLLGVIRLGAPQPASLSPLYIGQSLVHGIGFSPDGRTLAVVAIGSNAVIFIDTATNAIKHVTYVGRSPHEAFFTPNGSEVWVAVRGSNYIAVLDGTTYREKTRITVPSGPGMQIFSPDGKYGYVCSSFTPQTVVVSVAEHKIVGRVEQASPFCPNIAATPDGTQVWFTLKDSGKVQVFDARPPFKILRTMVTGPLTNHVNIVRNAHGMFAYVTVGGRNEIKVFRTTDFAQVATIPTGRLPHGIWPSGDGSRVYVGLENADQLSVIDTLSNKVIATIPSGQAAQAVVYVPRAVPAGSGTQGLQPLGAGSKALHFALVRASQSGQPDLEPPTSIALFEQGLVQVLQAAVTGLQPHESYVLALTRRSDGRGSLQPLATFKTNASGAAVVNAVGSIKQLLGANGASSRGYLVITSGTSNQLGIPVQVQSDDR
jgi:YVTN family beta-propeller protein